MWNVQDCLQACKQERKTQDVRAFGEAWLHVCVSCCELCPQLSVPASARPYASSCQVDSCRSWFGCCVTGCPPWLPLPQLPLPQRRSPMGHLQSFSTLLRWKQVVRMDVLFAIIIQCTMTTRLWLGPQAGGRRNYRESCLGCAPNYDKEMFWFWCQQVLLRFPTKHRTSRE